MIKHLIYDGYQLGLASMVYECFDQKSSGNDVTRAWPETFSMWNKFAFKSAALLNQELAK